MSMRHLMIGLLLWLPTALLSQEVVELAGSYNYYPPTNVCLEQARSIAIERARVQALADTFGTLIDSYQSTVSRNGEDSRLDYYCLTESMVKGEWLTDTQVPVLEESMENGILLVSAQVWGTAREIVANSVDVKAKVLRNGVEDRFEDQDFNQGDALYLSFSTPIQGYLSVYLLDEDGNAYCLLPYQDDQEGAFFVRANHRHVFFAKSSAMQRTGGEEYMLNADNGSSSQLMLYVLFSPHRFVKAHDNEAEEQVLSDGVWYETPRHLSMEEFNRWLLRQRLADRDFQVALTPLQVNGGTSHQATPFKAAVYRKVSETRTFATVNVAGSLAPQFSFGVSVGQVNRFGWFVSLMRNFNFAGFQSANDCDRDGYLEGGYLMQYTGEVSKTRLSLMAGGLVRVTNPLYVRLGVGYGVRNLYWKGIDGAWYRNKDFSCSGVDVSAGLQVHLHGWAFSAEAVTTQFKTAEAKIGIGYVF